MAAKSTKFAPKLGRRDVNAACIVIRIDPAKFAVRETALCLSTKTSLMFNKRRLAAGRAAVLAALFKIYPSSTTISAGQQPPSAPATNWANLIGITSTNWARRPLASRAVTSKGN